VHDVGTAHYAGIFGFSSQDGLIRSEFRTYRVHSPDNLSSEMDDDLQGGAASLADDAVRLRFVSTCFRQRIGSRHVGKCRQESRHEQDEMRHSPRPASPTASRGGRITCFCLDASLLMPSNERVMNIEVLLFARLREVVGKDRLMVHRHEMANVRDVWDGLRAQYPQVGGFDKSLLVSVNQEFAGWDTPIKDGDELAFFPPVSGGNAAVDATYPASKTGNVIQIVRNPIQLQALVEQLRQSADGAVVVFDGIVRNNTQSRRTLYLEYEGYEPMALRKMREIEEDLRRRWPINRVGIVHRLGRLEIGESSVVIVVTSAHRQAAFDACQRAIDTLKKAVPIWKKEFFEDGEIWVEGEMPSAEA